MLMEIKRAVVHVQFQRDKQADYILEKSLKHEKKTEFNFGDSNEISGNLTVEEVSDGQTARFTLDLPNTPFGENANLEMEKPVTLDLEITERPEKITAMYLFSDWWTRPAFLDGFDEILSRTQVAFLKYPDRYACIIPAVGEQYKTYLAPGKKTVVSLEITAYMGGMNRLSEPIFFLAEDQSLYRAIEKAFLLMAGSKGVLRKEKRRFPEMFRYLGWCTWDAFYREVDEEKIKKKAQEFEHKQVPVRWIMIDDGWLSVKDSLLYDFAPERKKFPNGFEKMTEEIRGKGKIRWFGVWHALCGYWSGVLPGSRLAMEEKEHLCCTANGKILPRPQAESAFGFYRDWYELLQKDGIDFVKVDAQSSLKNYFENNVPVCRAAREIHEGLEGAASYFGGAIINCMGMAMENIMARPFSAVSRNSDDFCPGKEYGFSEHLLQNAYNTLYHDEMYYCDWDMFWTDHKDSVKHSLLRGISGGPVYFSDKIGETIPEVLKPITYSDGEILMMDRGAKPSCDCVFSDPEKSGVLKLTNVAAHGQERRGGGIAVYNLTAQKQSCTFSPSDIWDITSSDKYWVYDYFNQKVHVCGKEEVIHKEIEKDGFAWYQILVCEGTGTFLGLIEKYAGFTAVEYMYETEERMSAVIKEQGPVGFLSLKKPAAVYCDGVDVTKSIEERGMLYILKLEEDSKKVCIEVVWDE